MRVASVGYATKVALFIDAGDPSRFVVAVRSERQTPRRGGGGKGEIYDYEGRIWSSNMQVWQAGRFIRLLLRIQVVKALAHTDRRFVPHKSNANTFVPAWALGIFQLQFDTHCSACLQQ